MPTKTVLKKSKLSAPVKSKLSAPVKSKLSAPVTPTSTKSRKTPEDESDDSIDDFFCKNSDFIVKPL